MDNLKNTTSSIFTIRQYNICVKFIKILYFSESVVEWAIVETGVFFRQNHYNRQWR